MTPRSHTKGHWIPCLIQREKARQTRRRHFFICVAGNKGHQVTRWRRRADATHAPSSSRRRHLCQGWTWGPHTSVSVPPSGNPDSKQMPLLGHLPNLTFQCHGERLLIDRVVSYLKGHHANAKKIAHHLQGLITEMTREQGPTCKCTNILHSGIAKEHLGLRDVP